MSGRGCIYCQAGRAHTLLWGRGVGVGPEGEGPAGCTLPHPVVVGLCLQLF